MAHFPKEFTLLCTYVLIYGINVTLAGDSYTKQPSRDTSGKQRVDIDINGETSYTGVIVTAEQKEDGKEVIYFSPPSYVPNNVKNGDQILHTIDPERNSSGRLFVAKKHQNGKVTVVISYDNSLSSSYCFIQRNGRYEAISAAEFLTEVVYTTLAPVDVDVDVTKPESILRPVGKGASKYHMVLPSNQRINRVIAGDNLLFGHEGKLPVDIQVYVFGNTQTVVVYYLTKTDNVPKLAFYEGSGNTWRLLSPEESEELVKSGRVSKDEESIIVPLENSSETVTPPSSPDGFSIANSFYSIIPITIVMIAL